MNPPISRRIVALLGAVTTALAAIAVSPATAMAEPHTSTQKISPVYAVSDALARQLARSMRDRTRHDRVVSAVAGGSAPLAGLRIDAAFATAVRSADRTVAAAKGLPTGTALLQVRLADPGMRSGLNSGAAPLIAATPTDDTATQLIAYDSAGASVTLDAAQIPSRPVLLVEVDTAKALPLGVALMRQRLAGGNRQPAAQRATAATNGYWATKINAVRLSDDEEPWFKGDAEIYSIVAATGLDGTPRADIVQMPYLNNDGVNYYPNQLLVGFNGYKYNLADVVMMEDDGDTNYQQLAQAIATALLTIADLGAYTPLVNAVLAAIPTSWYTDDPDYVDSWYTLSTASSGRLNGAAANGWMDVSPYFVTTL